MGVKLVHDDALGGGLQRQGEHDTLDVIPFINDQRLIDFPNWLDNLIAVLTGMLEAIQALFNGIVNILVARGKLIAEHMLLVLRVPLQALASRRGSAIRLEDCECIGLQVTEHTDGETVCQALRTIFARAGDPVAILKEGGKDLHKGVRLWREREGKKAVWVLEDIGHVMANALKAQYAKGACFQRFMENDSSILA